jgi:hypothetical protein
MSDTDVELKALEDIAAKLEQRAGNVGSAAKAGCE